MFLSYSRTSSSIVRLPRYSLGSPIYRHVLFAFFAALALVASDVPALADSRIALVIGNAAYARVPHLPNPVNDAEDIAAALKRSGFDVMAATNLSKAGMEEALIEFARAAREADVTLFYYTGHALQYNGVNYLVPIDARLNDEADLRRLVRLDDVIADVQQAKNLRILVLDSCRDNPLAEQFRRSLGASRSANIGRGLAKIDSPFGMIVAYATQAGRTADDGDGRNSPFTAAFLNNLEKKEEIGTIFRHVSAEVYKSTRQKQLPELCLSLIGEFYLNGSPPAAASPSVDRCQAASDHWRTSEAANTKTAFEEHLTRFPTCSFATLARATIAALAVPEPYRRRFDGIWAGKLVCEPFASGIPGWKYDLVGKVANGVFLAERGQVGKPGSEVFRGAIDSDGSAVIVQTGLSGPNDPFRRPLNTEFNNWYLVSFDGARATGVRSDSSSCYVNFSKR